MSFSINSKLLTSLPRDLIKTYLILGNLGGDSGVKYPSFQIVRADWRRF